MSVKLRKKILAGGKKSLYLDIFIDGQRHYDFLKLYLLNGDDAKIKAANNEKLILAEANSLKILFTKSNQPVKAAHTQTLMSQTLLTSRP